MKKIIGLILTVILGLCLTGCGREDKKTVLKKVDNKISNINGYKIDAKMELINNNDIYKYDVTVSYKKKDNYRVSLRNTMNNHEQIILKNKDGVYLLNPSLNKSFKFQSSWPNGNSQIYLIGSVLKDIKNDPNYKMKKTGSNYIFESKVNFKNDANLSYQKVVVDKNYNIKKVVVMDKDDNPAMRVVYESIDTKAKFDKNYFVLEENMKTGLENSSVQETGSFDEAIYPMYLPDETYLETEKTIELENGKRKILSFAGKTPFMLVEEPASYETDLAVIPTSGDLTMFMDTVAVINDTSVNWVSSGVEYYLVSTTLSQDELVSVAKSIATMPVGK